MRTTVPGLAVLAILIFDTSAGAGEFRAGTISVVDPWTRAVPDASKVAGGFATIVNHGTTPDTLIGGTAAIAGRVEIHQMSMQDGVMRMSELKPGLVVKPGETVTLKPGAFHLMLMDLGAAPKPGTPFKGTLVFEKAGTIAIDFAVEPFGTAVKGDGGKAMPSAGTGHSDHGHGTAGASGATK